MPHLAAWDGLRAVAVGAVLLYHGGVSVVGGGFLGVEVFFVLSGYLITALLSAEWSNRGGVSIVGFYRRRIRRLVPAALVMVTGTTVVAAFAARDALPALRGDTVASLLGVENLWLLVRQQSYFEQFGRPSLLQHVWSLSIEAQFYLAWPLALWVLHRRVAGPRARAGLVLGAAAVAAGWMAVQGGGGGDLSGVYYRTDTRLAGLLLGSGLALAWPVWRLEPGRFLRHSSRVHRAAMVDAAGLAALMVLVGLLVGVNERTPWLYRGGFQLAAAATGVLVLAVAHPDASVRWRRLLGGPMLAWVGARSYGIYLWHWPVFALTRPGADVSLAGPGLLLTRVTVTLVLADLSFRLVEIPAQRWLGRAGHPELVAEAIESGAGWRPRWVSSPSWAMAGLAAVVVSSWAVPASVSVPPGLEVASVGLAPISVTSSSTSTTTAPSPLPPPESTTSSTAGEVPTATTLASTSSTVPATSETTVVATAGAASPTPKVTAVGDSVMLDAHEALQARLGDVWVDAAIGRQFSEAQTEIANLQAADLLGEVVVLHLGTNAAISDQQFDQLLASLSAARRVVVVNVRVPRAWEPEVNRVIGDGVKRWPNAVLVDWHAASNAQDGVFWDDGVHLRPSGEELYADLVAAAVR